MKTYVNQQAINEIYLPIESETDPQTRVAMITSLQPEFTTRHIEAIAKTCYELKYLRWSSGQIADEFSISERRVKRLITHHAKKVKSQNPLYKFAVIDAMDISDLVQKGSPMGRRNLA